MELRVDDPQAVAIYQLGLAFDPGVLHANVELTEDVSPPNCAAAVNDTVDGKICLYITCFPALTMSHALLARLHLQGQTIASSSVTFDGSACPEAAASGCSAADAEEAPIPCESRNGSVEVQATITATLPPQATATPTATPTPTTTPTIPTPTATATIPLSLDLLPIPQIGVLPGGVACFGVKLAGASGNQVAQTRSTIGLGQDAQITFLDCSLPTTLGPQSAFNKAIHYSNNAGILQVDVNGSDASLVDGDLFACRARVSAQATTGTTFPLSNEGVASNASGNEVGVALEADTALRVTTCGGDCNGNHQISVAELQRCVAHFLGQPICAPNKLDSNCPAADTDHNGAVSISEVSRCVNNFLGGCPQS